MTRRSAFLMVLKPGRVIDCGGRAHNDVYLSIAKAIGKNVTTVGLAAWCKGPMIT